MSSLQKAGYERNLGLNHNGQFGGFLQTVQTQGGLNINPMPIEDLQIDQHAFDGSPVHDDLAVLSHWLDLRSKDKASRVALYYNTISLHDGNHLIDIKVSGDSIQTYKIRLKKLLDELDQFMQEIDSSGRRALVVMVPEHGAAIRSDKMQIAGLREIPSPAITLVPVGIKVVGPDAHRLGETLQIDKPTSFLAVSYIVEKMLEKSPYGSAGFNPDDYVDGLPTTNYVAQNASATTMKINGHYYLKEGDESWTNYDTGAQP
jgi:cellulose synthase operon protein YhjU